jgi:hypothetical protein
VSFWSLLLPGFDWNLLIGIIIIVVGVILVFLASQLSYLPMVQRFLGKSGLLLIIGGVAYIFIANFIKEILADKKLLAIIIAVAVIIVFAVIIFSKDKRRNTHGKK